MLCAHKNNLLVEFLKSSVALIICVLNLLFPGGKSKIYHYCGDLFIFLCNNFKFCLVYLEDRLFNVHTFKNIMLSRQLVSFMII